MGDAAAAGAKPPGASDDIINGFPMKIAIKHVILGFFIFAIICDEHRRPRRDAPAADQQPGAFLKNTELPRRAPRGALMRGTLISAI